MKEKIEAILNTSHTDMGYRFLCITQEDIPETISRLHVLFLQSQIDMLREVRDYSATRIGHQYINEKINSLKQQLNTVK